MRVSKNDPYLTCTSAYKLGKTVANDTFSVRFNDGLGGGSVSGIWGKRKGSMTFGPPTEGDHPACYRRICTFKPHLPLGILRTDKKSIERVA